MCLVGGGGDQEVQSGRVESRTCVLNIIGSREDEVKKGDRSDTNKG